LKWIDSKIKYVKGIDLSPGEIEEANQRYQRTISEGRAGVTKCEFLDTPNLGIADWKEAQEYDVITCMFALHYFFVSEAALKQVREMFIQNPFPRETSAAALF